jgi:PPE-repeat protein
MIKGYKVFNPDWTCRGFQYKVGETFTEDVTPTVCKRGFHFCEKAADCFNYYKFDSKNKVAEVIALGVIDRGENKSCTDKIQIVREIPWTEVLEIVNTGRECTGCCNTGNCDSGNWNSGDYNGGHYNSGDYNSGNRNSGSNNSGDYNTGSYNSGDWNSGDFNSGHRNSGNQNSGSYNSGDRNSCNRNRGSHNSGSYNVGHYNIGDYNVGDWNSGDFNTGSYNTGDWNSGNYNSGHCNNGDFNDCNFSNGCFNTVEPKIYMFNKPSEWTYSDWEDSEAYAILKYIPQSEFKHIPWRDMSNKERALHPEAEITGGYLKEVNVFECTTTWWHGLSEDAKMAITTLPNFDKEVFKKITGIDIDE